MATAGGCFDGLKRMFFPEHLMRCSGPVLFHFQLRPKADEEQPEDVAVDHLYRQHGDNFHLLFKESCYTLFHTSTFLHCAFAEK